MISLDGRFRVVARTLVGTGVVGLLAACAGSTPSDKPPPPAASVAPAPAPTPVVAAGPKPFYGSFGLDTDGMDRSVKPGDNFYRHVNGRWHERTEIPPDRPVSGMFTRLAEEANEHSRALIEGAAKAGAPEGSEARKIGDLYASFLDEGAIEQKGVAPLKPELDRVAAIKSRRDLARALGETLRADVDALNTGDVTTDRLFGLWVVEDLNEPSRYAPYLLQGGLGLPDRDYYLVDNPRFVALRDKYRAYIAAVLALAGVPDAKAKADRIYELEKKIATAHWSQVDTREIKKANNPWKRDDFARKAPGLDWASYFDAAGLGKQGDFIVWQPSALSGMAKLVGSESIAIWKDYLAFHAVSRAAAVLPKAFADANFGFYGRELAGVEQPRERRKRAVDFVNGAMGEAVGKLYVEKHFPPRSKAAADEMVRNIVAALGRHIDALAWMSPETKAKAKEKLGTLQVGIGHPAAFRDYGAFAVQAGDAYGNAQRASRFEYERNLKKLGRPVDRGEWFMVPQEVNALNAPQQNSIAFPAAILQPPFFDADADPAVNYGGIGSVIGHEIVHSFDDVGAEFDARGKLSNWWTPQDAAKFQAAGKALADQYSTYKPLPDASVNGELTLGENIADVAGIAISFDGYRASLGGRPAPVLEGYSGEQRFFLGFAQVWRTKYREPLLRRLLMTDGHSPGEFRASTVRNQDGWYEAFDVRPGQGLYLPP
ncbi:MAG: M13 family metallopeptidase, partial [Polyangiaceae bacterium]|nr:M13 family metallopeptidase [Polyangiaceae bacterium]